MRSTLLNDNDVSTISRCTVMLYEIYVVLRWNLAQNSEQKLGGEI